MACPLPNLPTARNLIQSNHCGRTSNGNSDLKKSEEKSLRHQQHIRTLVTLGLGLLICDLLFRERLPFRGLNRAIRGD